MSERTLEQIVRESMDRHGPESRKPCDECDTMYAALRAADLELARGREAIEILRDWVDDSVNWRVLKDNAKYLLAAHPEAAR